MGKRELIVLLNLSSWCLVMVERLFLVVPLGCLRFVVVVFPDHTYLLFYIQRKLSLDGKRGGSQEMLISDVCHNYQFQKVILINITHITP